MNVSHLTKGLVMTTNDFNQNVGCTRYRRFRLFLNLEPSYILFYERFTDNPHISVPVARTIKHVQVNTFKI